MQTQSATRITAIAALIATAGLAVASNETPYVPGPDADPLVQSTAALSGQYSATIGSEVVYGSGGFNASVFVPLILERRDVLINTPVAWNSPMGAAGFVSTWGSGSNNSGQGVVVSISENGNAAIVNRSSRFLSSGPGQVLDDGTWLFRANFNAIDGQNNMELFQNAANKLPGSGVKPMPTGSKIFRPGYEIDGVLAPAVPADNVQAQLSIPTGVSRPGGFLLGQANFNPTGSGLGVPSAVNIWDISYSQLGTVGVESPDYSWPQAFAPLAFNPDGQQPGTGSVRLTKPLFFTVPGCEEQFVIFGIGYVGAEFGGGNMAPRMLIIDTLDTSETFNGFGTFDNTLGTYEIIKADGGSSLNPTSRDQRFIGGGATGSVGNFPSRFDVNNQGQIAIVHEDFSTSGGTTYQVRLYNPVIDGCSVTYPDFEVIASTGVVYDSGIEFTPFVDTFVNLEDPDSPVVTQSANNTPFSGVSIDNDGNISFTATDGLFFEDRIVNPESTNPVSASFVYASTTSLFHYHAASQSLHRIVSGGQNGTEFSSSGNPDLKLGRFTVDNNDSDSFGAYSAHNGVATVSFRNGFDDSAFEVPESGNVQNGGQLNPGTMNRQGVRGVVLVDLGEYDPKFGGGPNCIGDADGSGGVDLDDLNLVLINFGSSVTPGTNGDVDGNGTVNLDDLNLVLVNFGQCNEE